MQRGAWVANAALLAAILTLPSLASATYEPGSSLEADKVALDGTVDALVTQAVATFVGRDASMGVSLLLTAKELSLNHRVIPVSCAAAVPENPFAAGSCAAATGRDDTMTLRDASVTLTKTLGASKVIVTNDANAPTIRSTSFRAGGSLVASTAATAVSPAFLGANAKTMHISPYASDWTEQSPRAFTDDVYTVEALNSSLGSRGGMLRAQDAGLQILLQGFEIRVAGTDADGKKHDDAYRTPIGSASDDISFLVLETTDADLKAVSGADLLAYGARTVDVQGAATFFNAKGHVVEDGDATDYAGEQATLAGPLSLTRNTVKEGPPVRSTYTLSSSLHVADLVAKVDEREDTTQLLAAGAAGAGGAALLAGLVYFWPRLKFGATLLFLPLYSRIERTSVLEHEKRDEIYELIRAAPGIHAHEIGEKARIGWGTTVYHLKMLENHSLVVSKKSGRYKRFFVNTGEYTKKKDIYGALRNETAKSVADYIVNHPGCSQKDLCAALGIQPSLASWHVEKLEGVELVKRVKDGRMVRYFAGAAWADLNVRVSPTGGADTPAET